MPVPTVSVPVGSKSRIDAPATDDGLCSVPRGTTNTAPCGSTTSRSPSASRSTILSSPSSTRKNSSVSSCACHTCSPATFAIRTS